MDYKKSIYEFQSVPRFGLHRMHRLCNLLNNPQDKLKTIHVAGTNGKGSTCAFIESILMSAGYCVGKYSSPELIRVNERIVVNGKQIGTKELDVVLDEIHNAAKGDAFLENDMPSPYEVSTMAAFVYFEKMKCDIVIMETGLGGRLDSTNVCQPIISVITPIALDHQQFLGNSIEEIALEKAGIIKQGVMVVSSKQEKKADAVIQSVCTEKGCKLVEVNEKYIKLCGAKDFCEIISYKNEQDLLLGLCGLHQVINAATAIETILALCCIGFSVSGKSIKQGLTNATHKGRMEMFSKQPILLFDGAHNQEGTKALASSLKRYCPDKRFRFVMAVMKDKCISEMLCELKGIANEFVAVNIKENPRAISAYELEIQMGNTGVRSSMSESIKNAIYSKEDTIVCGSLYLYADFYSAFHESKRTES